MRAAGFREMWDILRMTSSLDTYLFPLLADGVCPAGTLDYDLASGSMTWSEGVYGIHGFRPGQIVPTLEVLMAHQHADDRGPFTHLLKNLADNGGQIALLHRVVDSRGRQRQVFTSLHATNDGRGTAARATGFMVDLTRTIREETRLTAEAAVQGALAHTAAIEQAKGVIRALLGVSADTAFSILAAHSQHTNTKVHVVAATILNAVDEGTAARLLKDCGTLRRRRDPE